MEDIGLGVFGVIAGILSGLFGIGGGIVMVPVLITLFSFQLIEATATSLTALLLPVGIFGVIAYYKAGLVYLKAAIWITVGLLVGSVFGAEIAIHISDNLLKLLYIIFIGYVAFSFWGMKSDVKQKGDRTTFPPVNIIGLIALGIFTGIVASLFGKGGGIIIVPFCIAFFKFDTKVAVATSLAALQLPVGLPGVIVYGINGNINYKVAVILAVGIVIGTYFGTKIALRTPTATFKRIYAIFLVLVIAMLITKIEW